MDLMTKEMVTIGFLRLDTNYNNNFFLIGEMLRINPQETIMFHKHDNEYVGTVEIFNIDQKPITYKV